MRARTFDNLKFKKIRWIEIGITAILSIFTLGILFSNWNPPSDKASFIQVLAVLFGGMVIGIGIQTMMNNLYIKKELKTNI